MGYIGKKKGLIRPRKWRLVIEGAKQKGVWRAIGEAGVCEFEDSEDTALQERVSEHSGEGDESFAEVVFESKKPWSHGCSEQGSGHSLSEGTP